MAKVTRGPATQIMRVCACGAKTAVPANLVGKFRCGSCGAVRRR